MLEWKAPAVNFQTYIHMKNRLCLFLCAVTENCVWRIFVNRKNQFHLSVFRLLYPTLYTYLIPFHSFWSIVIRWRKKNIQSPYNCVSNKSKWTCVECTHTHSFTRTNTPNSSIAFTFPPTYWQFFVIQNALPRLRRILIFKRRRKKKPYNKTTFDNDFI